MNIRRGKATEAVFAQAKTGEHYYKSLGVVHPQWEITEVPVAEIREIFLRYKDLKMIQERRGYLIRIPNIYAHEFYLLPFPEFASSPTYEAG